MGRLGRWLGLVALAVALSTVSARAGRVAAVADGNSGALFLHEVANATSNDQTDSNCVAVDGSGGIHTAFESFTPDVSGNSHSYYAYCAPGTDCANVGNWSTASLNSTAGFMEATQIALDAQGHPRLLFISGDHTGDPLQDHYFFATCDGNCTSASNWTTVDVLDVDAGNNTYISKANKHFFALDPSGRPRFVVNGNGKYYYVYCDSDCTSASNWASTALNGSAPSPLMYRNTTPALTFNASGQPRMLAPFVDPNTFDTGLDYFECNANDCSTNADSWSNAPVIQPMGNDDAPYSSLRLTSTGQPRFAFYGPLSGQAATLYYFSCDSGCTTDTNWAFAAIGLAPASGFNTSGQQPDLALDGQDRPRLSFRSADTTLGSGLGYAWCDSDCQSSTGTWQHRLADADTQLNSDWPRPAYLGCNYTSWLGGFRSSLALDSAGNPRVGGDSEHWSNQCSDNQAHRDYAAVRFVSVFGDDESELPAEDFLTPD